MSTSVSTLQNLKARLESFTNKGQLTLNEQTIGENASDIIQIFNATFGTPSFAIKDPILLPPADNILRIGGQSPVTLYDVDQMRISCIFSLTDNNTLILIIKLMPPNNVNWTFSSSFFNLENTFFDQLSFTSATFAIASRPVYDPDLGVILGKGVTFFIQPTGFEGPLEPLKYLALSNLHLSPMYGPLEETTNSRSLALEMPFPDLRIEIGGVPIISMENPKLVLGNSFSLDPDFNLNMISIQGDVAFDRLILPLELALPYGLETWKVGLIRGRYVALASFTHFLASLTSVDLISSLPESFLWIDNFYLSVFSITFDLDKKQFSSFSVGITSDPTDLGSSTLWKIIPDLLELRNLYVELNAYRRIEWDGTQSIPIQGSVSGTFLIGNALSVIGSIPLPIGDGDWTLRTTPNQPLPGLKSLNSFVNSKDITAVMPGSVGKLDGLFTLMDAELVVNPNTFSLTEFSFILLAEHNWTIIEKQLVINNVLIALDIRDPFTNTIVTGEISGAISIGQAEVQVAVQRQSEDEDWSLEIRSNQIPLPTIGDITALVNTDLAMLLPQSLAQASFMIYDLDIQLNLSQRKITRITFGFASTTKWVITENRFEIDTFGIQVDLSWPADEVQAWLYLYGELRIVDRRIEVSAERTEDNTWTFSGALAPDPPLNVVDLLSQFLDFDPQRKPILKVGDLAVVYTIDGPSGNTSYLIQGSTADFWEFDLTSDIHLKLQAGISFARDFAGTYSGMIAADFFLNNLQIVVSYVFNATDSTLALEIVYKQLRLCATLFSGQDAQKQPMSLLKVTLGDLSFGQIAADLVELARPGTDFTLDAPWSVLNEINLKNLELVVNLTDKTVGISYRVDANLGFAYVESIGLVYVNKAGKGTVDIVITGRMLDQTYPESKPLTWDLLDDPAPPIPGKGSALLDLKYVGLGQHVSLTNGSQIDTVAGTIAALKSAMLPVEETNKNANPLAVTQNAGLKFDRDSQILFGVDFVVIGAVSLSVVFNDPYLYGLLVRLAGEKAGSFAGLSFELLYKRVTDDIGVFKIELRLPDAFRQLEFGEVSVTLPVVKVDIYTNGNFRVDLGFPKNGDFSDSFSLQIFPFVGYGGFYLAMLTGATSTRVPRITNGQFSPVIEFGLGLRLGVGKDINKGILKATISITVEAILEGVLAWFNPNDTSARSARYYLVQGTAAIVGKVYGSVDFKLVKVNFSVVASVSATLIIEAYEPIVLALSAEVSVEASVTILHVEVKFHYQLTIDQSFIIGAKTTPPWIVDTGAAPALGAGAARPALQSGASRAKRTLSADETTTAASGGALTWIAVPVWPEPKTIALTLLPAFTTALPKGESGPAYAIVMLLFVENTVPVDATGAQDAGRVTVTHSTQTTDPREISFNLLVRGGLAWAIQTYLGRLDGSVTSEDLAALYQALDQADTARSGFSYQDLANFIAQNFVFRIAGIPEGYSDSGSISPTSATIFPMIPELMMTLPEQQPIDFRTNTSASQTYTNNIDAYFRQLAADSQASVAADPFLADQAGDTANALRATSSESLATMVFRDYFAMLVKAAVQAAIDTLTGYRYALLEGDTLQGIANSFAQLYTVQPGDTVPSLLERFRMRSDAYGQLNGIGGPANLPLMPGDHVRVWMSATPSSIAQANADHELAKGAMLVVKHLTYEIKSGDTLASIASAFGIADVAALAREESNGTAAGVLLPGAFLTIARMETPSQLPSQIPYQTANGDTLGLIAAWLFVRNGELRSDPASPDPLVAWYKQAIADLNPSTIQASDAPLPLPVDKVLTIPAPSNDSAASSRSYTIRPGDTLDLIAGYYTALQTRAAYEAGIETHISDLNPGVDFTRPGQMIALPARRHVIQPTESLASIANVFGVDVDDLAYANATGVILSPRARITRPDAQHQVARHETLAGIAQQYNVTVAQLADDNTLVPDLFDDPRTLLIPNLRELDIEDLLAQVTEQGHANQIAGMLSRFLLHGLRLPAPNDQGFLGLSEHVLASATPTPIDLFGLYDLIGQQIQGPSREQAPYAVSFTTSDAPWVEFAASFVVRNGDTFDALRQRYPQLQALNPAAQLQPDPPIGSVLIGQLLTGGLDLTLTSDLLGSHYPARTVLPEIIDGPRPLTLFEDVSIRYSLRQHIRWQSAVTPLFPEATPGELLHSAPSIWLFSSTLLSAVARTGSARIAYKLMADSTTQRSRPQIAEIANYAWATAIRVRVRQAASTEDHLAPQPNTYVLGGADEASHDLMLALWTYLDAQDSAEEASSIYLLYAPGMDSASPIGLASDQLDSANTFVLKTNLSTLTTSGAEGPNTKRSAPPSTGQPAETFSASIAQVKQFVQFLWEASITGTGGYYLNYVAGDGQTGLPNSLFAKTTAPTLWVVIVLASRQSASIQARELLPFMNCVVVGDNIDPANANVFVERADKQDTTKIATVPPGHIGFELSRRSPESTSYTNNQHTTQELFSMLSYQLIPSQAYTASNTALPIGPTTPPQDGHQASWYYHQVIPVAKFAARHTLPVSPALPNPADDPYAGVAANLAKRAPVTLSFSLQDVFGNIGALTSPIADLPIQVGYFDDLIGLSQWPSTTSGYTLDAQATSPTLDVELALQLSNYLPGAGISFRNAMLNASAHLNRYKQIYYQLWQPDVQCTLTTSLNQARAAQPHPYAIEKFYLTGYVDAAYVFLSAILLLKEARHTMSEPGTLATLANTYLTTPAALGAANQDIPTAALFAAPVKIPIYAVVHYGDSLQSIASGGGSDNQRVNVTASDVAGRNTHVPLNDGVVLAVKTVSVTGSGEDRTLNAVASAQSISTTDLVTRNANRPNILAEKTLITVNGVSVAIASTDTFVTLLNKFAFLNQTVSLADIATQNAGVQGIFVDSATLTITDYTVQSGDTLLTIADAIIQSGDTVAPLISPEQQIDMLAGLNATCPNIFVAGTMLFVKDGGELQSRSADTLAEIAADQGLSLDQLANYNADTPLTNRATLLLPDRVTFDQAAQSTYAPYAVKGGETLVDISAAFANVPIDDLLQLNQDMAGLFVPGISIQLKGHSVVTAAGDSINAIVGKFKQQWNVDIPLAQLGDALGTRTDILRDGGLLVCPLPSTGNLATFAALSDRFNVDPGALGQANCALHGLLKAGASVTIGRQNRTKTLTTNVNETLNSLVARFLTEDRDTHGAIETTPAEIVRLNATTLTVNSDVLFILPPNVVSFKVGLGMEYLAQPNYPDTIFQVVVNLQVARADALIAPDFASVPRVREQISLIAPASGGGSVSTPVSLQPFADTFESVFKTLKLAAGRSQQAGENQAVQSLWAVDFGASGISSFHIDTTPRYYALKPLANQLISQMGVAVHSYNANTGKLAETANQLNFQSVDLEVWARDFLAAMDVFLSPAYSVPAYTLQPTHAAFNKVVAAKKKLASAIAGGVDTILDLPTDADALKSAQDEFAQNLLINLSHAYATDVIIQYPVTAASPYSEREVAPRLSGKPSSAVYVTGPADTLHTIATALNVSVPYITIKLAHVHKILKLGLQVTYQYDNPDQYPDTKPYIVQESDTLETIRQYFCVTGGPHPFDVPIDTLADKLSWQPAGGGLFAPNTTITIVSLSYKLDDSSSFEQLEAYFDVGLDEIVLANQDAPGMFRQNTVISYGSASTTIADANTTLKQVAAAVQAESLSALAESLRVTGDILNPTFIAHITQFVPPIEISTVKSSLFNGQSTINFLVKVNSAPEAKKALLNLDYVINELEYNVTNPARQAPEAQGYQNSAWLSFIIPIGKKAPADEVVQSGLGQLELPLPLRSYPPQPFLVSQSGRATFPKPTSIAEARQWDYSLTYEHLDAAQDTSYLRVAFNEVANSEAQVPSPVRGANSFFQKLAQFSIVYPALKDDLAKLLLHAAPDASPDPITLAALDTFAQLIDDVASQWNYALNDGPSAASDSPSDVVEYQIQTTHKDLGDRSMRDSLIFRLIDTTQVSIGANTTTPTNTSNLRQFPVVSVTQHDTVVQLQKTSETGQEAVYRYPDGIPAFTALPHHITYPGNDVRSIQNARGSAFVTRNQRLTTAGKTKECFVFTTPMIAFADTINPLIEYDGLIPIKTVDNDLILSLNAMFADVLGMETKSRTIKVSLQYGYELVAPVQDEAERASIDPIITLLPIAYWPNFTFADNFATQVQTVIAKHSLSARGGMYVLDIVLYSATSLGEERPLLELQRLGYFL